MSPAPHVVDGLAAPPARSSDLGTGMPLTVDVANTTTPPAPAPEHAAAVSPADAPPRALSTTLPRAAPPLSVDKRLKATRIAPPLPPPTNFVPSVEPLVPSTVKDDNAVLVARSVPPPASATVPPPQPLVPLLGNGPPPPLPPDRVPVPTGSELYRGPAGAVPPAEAPSDPPVACDAPPPTFPDDQPLPWPLLGLHASA
jgi:hypothetical protein